MNIEAASRSVAAGLRGAALALSVGSAAAAQGAPGDVLAALAALPAAAAGLPSGPFVLALPADHGAHPAARAESWVVSAHLRDAAGATVAAQAALTRLGVIAPDAPEAASPWALRDLWRGHVALSLSGDGADRAEAVERIARAAAGVAGHDAAAGEVRLDDWTLRHEPDGALTLTVSAGGVDLAVRLTPEKPALAVGGEGPLRGYAAPRWRATGVAAGRALEGLAWVEHFWGELPLPGGPVAWDRMTLHLDDGRDLSLTRTRRRDGLGAPSVDAALIGPEGRATPLEDATVDVARTWRGPEGAAWPVAWRIRAAGLELTAAPVADARLRAFAEPLWIGPVTAEGRIDGRAAAGTGMMTLTGYDAP